MEESLNIQVNIADENIDLSIDSDYNTFLQNICNILKIYPEQLDSFVINYYDEDGDSILISTLEDYQLFFQQVQQGIVNKLIIEKKEEKRNDNNAYLCNDEEINSQEKMEQSNYINNSIKNDNYNNSKINNNIYGSNKDKKNNKKSNCNAFKNNNSKNNKNIDIPIDNIVYGYKCSSCSVYPIICVLYYCDKCSLYLCEECEKKS